MKLNHLITIITFISLTGMQAKSQDESKGYISLKVNPAQSQINYDFSLKDIKNEGKINVNFGLEAGLNLGQYFSIFTGLGVNTYNSTLTLNTYNDSLNANDGEEDYLKRIKGNDIKEEQKIMCIDIPLGLKAKINFNDDFGAYLDLGVSFGIPITKTFKSSGTFSYRGYYKTDEVELMDLPDHGFAENYKKDIDTDLKIKSLLVSGFAGLGLYYHINDNLTVNFGGKFFKGLSDISDYSINQFHLSDKMENFSSLLEASSKSTFQSIGGEIGISYRF